MSNKTLVNESQQNRAESQMLNKESSQYQLFLRRWGPNIVLAIILILLLGWLCTIMRFYSQKEVKEHVAAWAILPMTGIYIVANIWVALSNGRSAQAAVASVELLKQQIDAQQLLLKAQLNPVIHVLWDKIWYKPGGYAEIKVANLSSQPAFNISFFFWKMEKGKDNILSVQGSSLIVGNNRFMMPQTSDRLVVLKPSIDTEVEKSATCERLYRHALALGILSTPLI